MSDPLQSNLDSLDHVLSMEADLNGTSLVYHNHGNYITRMFYRYKGSSKFHALDLRTYRTAVVCLGKSVTLGQCSSTTVSEQTISFESFGTKLFLLWSPLLFRSRPLTREVVVKIKSIVRKYPQAQSNLRYHCVQTRGFPFSRISSTRFLGISLSMQTYSEERYFAY